MAPKPANPEDELYMPFEVAAMFGVHVRTVGEWARAGKFGEGNVIRTPGGQRRFRTVAVRALLNGQRS